jgi:hypothetical protein
MVHAASSTAVVVVVVAVVSVAVVVVIVVVIVVVVIVVVVVTLVVVVDVDLMQQSTKNVFGEESRYSKPGSALRRWSQLDSPVGVTPSLSNTRFLGKQ